MAERGAECTRGLRGQLLHAQIEHARLLDSFFSLQVKSSAIDCVTLAFALDNESHDLGPVLLPVRPWPGNFRAYCGGANPYSVLSTWRHAKGSMDRRPLRV